MAISYPEDNLNHEHHHLHSECIKIPIKTNPLAVVYAPGSDLSKLEVLKTERAQLLKKDSSIIKIKQFFLSLGYGLG
ncbi:hypothetical protein GCM10008119_17270 [Pedobacter mendelii]|uniref:Uncharacterized protein n=1 Tax=Pedobacter mendelii TaxID=1908240 RepID=A0ABQ2BG89_9SPHI|nr:hypothetical protein GCM10008119_17270 [Pedobacter mendelii]